MEAQGILGITERTGSGLEDVARGRLDVAERTGSQLEQSAIQRGQGKMGIEERTGAARETIARERGALDLGIEEQAANMRWQLGAGMTPQQVGLAGGVGEYLNAQSQQRMANAAATMQAPMPYVGYYQADRHAQPTTTTTSAWGPALFGGVTGAAGAGASIYGGMSQASAMRNMFSDGFSGGGITYSGVNPY
jgi:hypothetical protein